MEKLGGQGVDGVVQLTQEGLHCITCKLKRLLKLKVEEVTLVNALKMKKIQKDKLPSLLVHSVRSKHESLLVAETKVCFTSPSAEHM